MEESKAKPLSLKQAIFLAVGMLGTIALMVTVIVIFIVTTKPEVKELQSPGDIVDAALKAMPIIDGRNNFSATVRHLVFSDLSTFNFSANLSAISPWAEFNWTQTDIPKLVEGKVGGMIWSAFTDCKSQHKDAVSQTMEQIDLLKRLIEQYDGHLQLALSSSDIQEAISSKRIASLLSVGGGHSLQASAAVLRLYHDVGVRAITLTHDCHTPWADSYIGDMGEGRERLSSGISEFGNSLILEMNRLGLLIDLSHASKDAALSGMKQSTAPVMISAVGAYSLCRDYRNVQDEVLAEVLKTDSLVMVGVDLFYDSCGDREATITDIAEHIKYIRNKTSVNNVGIGGNFDGTDRPPKYLEDPSKYPALFLKLAESGWSQEDLEKLSGRNLLRVLTEVEREKSLMSGNIAMQKTISQRDLDNHGVNQECMTAVYKEL